MSTLKFVANLLHSQWMVSLPSPTTSFAGQTVIVTGANVGLGYEAAKHFVQLGASKVIIACRSLDKGEAAKQKIEESTKQTGIVEVWQLDLSSYDSVKEFASRAKTLERLDVLLENAGVSTQDFQLTEDNETTITTNVVSTFLLGFLLLPKLRETGQKHNKQPYLVIVASDVHFLTDLPERKDPSGSIFGTLNDRSKARMGDRYNASKLLEVLTVREVVATQAAKGYPVIINTVNPGLCHSELMREMGFFATIIKFVFHARTTEEGSRTFVHACQAGKESHGQFMSDCDIKPPAPFVTSEEGAKTQTRVWKELSEKLEKIEPGILKNI